MKNFKSNISPELKNTPYIITDVQDSKTSEYLYILNKENNEEFSIRISNHDAICLRSKIAKHQLIYQLHKGSYYMILNLNYDYDINELDEICEEIGLKKNEFEVYEIGSYQIEIKFNDFYKTISKIAANMIMN